MSPPSESSIIRVGLAGLLAWLVPGLGHIYLGFKKRGTILLIAITLTFWTGVAIGGVRGVIDHRVHKLWFAAQACTGGNTLTALGLHSLVGFDAYDPRSPVPPYTGPWMSVDIGIHYAGVAGLLNLLVILDAIVRADPAAFRHMASGPPVREESS